MTPGRVRWEESMAAACIRMELGVEVQVNDDGSAQGMYDLRLLFPDRAPGAAEVTAVADPEAVALGRLLYEGERWIVPGIVGGWMCTVRPAARFKRLKEDLPLILQSFESMGIHQADPELWWEPGIHDQVLRQLEIVHLFQSGTDFPGSVYLIMDPGSDRTTGREPDHGGPLLEWLADWFARPDKADNLAKLAASGAAERHLFLVVPAFAEAPFAVANLLMRDEAPLPDSPPELPAEVTHVWVASTWASGHGMRWSPDSGWSRFDKKLRQT